MPVYSTDKGKHCATCGASPCLCDQQESLAGAEFVTLQRQVKGRSGKPVILIDGVPGTRSDLKKLAKTLKSTCGVGGSLNDRTIIIQGDKRDAIEETLRAMGMKVKRTGG